MSLTDILIKLSKSGGDVLSRNLSSRVTNILDYLQGLTEIRIFTANSQNFGHQASTVNILRNLIRMGVTKPSYTLVLYGKNEPDYTDLAMKIAVLIPQYTVLAESFVLNGCTVKVKLMDPTKPELPLGPLAINGGFDNLEDDKVPPYDQLNVVNYLQLQPYAWHRGTNMVRIDDGGLTDIIDLDKLSPGTNMPRRAFYLDPKVTPDDWEKMKSGKMAVETNICEYLLEQLDASKIFLTVGYGYGTKGGGLTSLYNMLAGMRQSQITLAAAQKPTVLVAIGVDSAESSELSDADFGLADFRSPTEAFTNFLNSQVVGHIPSVGFGSTEVSLKKVKQAVEELEADKNKNQKVLIVFLDKVPGPLFDQLYKRASVPPLLEGQNTVELMLNLGKPYLKISSNETDAVFGYPTLPLSSRSSSAQALDAQGRAFNGIRAAEPSSWFPERATYPPAQLPPISKAYLTPQGSTLAKYFTRLSQFFHDELNDKLLRGLDLFVNVVGPGQFAAPQAALVRAGRKAVEKADENIVEALYLKLVAFTHDGVLNLLQAVTSGDIYDFFSAVGIDQLFRITDAIPELSKNKEVCTLHGNTLAFGGDIGVTKVNFEFVDANDSGKLGTTFKAEFSAKWALPGADWLSISKPVFGFTMSPVSKVPFIGTVGAHITAGLAADMKVTVPVEPDIFEFQVLFVAPRPGISNLFQMVGGINLQQYLPSQLQLLTDIEAASFTMRYNYALGSVDAMSATLETPTGKQWNLIPKVDVTSIQMEVTVIAPGDRVARKTMFAITGEFAIVEAKAYIAAYAPQLRVMGGLRENSEPLSVRAIVTTYLGEEFASILPQPIAEAKISRLAFLVDQGAGRYSFGMTVQTLWEIPFGKPIFTVKELGFDIDATSRAIDTPTGKEGRTIVVTGEQGETAGPSTTEITGSFTGNIEVDTAETDKAQISVGANYLGKDKGWTFSGKQTGGEVNLGYIIHRYLGFPKPKPEYDYALDGLAVTAATGDGAWSFAAKTKGPWKIPFIPGFELEANFSAGYNPPPKKFLLEGSTIVVPFGALAAANGCDGTGNYARVEVITRWNNIELLVWFNYCGSIKSFGITWEFLEAEVTERENKDKKLEWIGILRFKKGTTLGEIVSKMVTWLTGSAFALEAPWSVLNTISLNALSLEFNFSTNAVSFNVDIGPIELGFARIDSIGVVYNSNTEDPKAKSGVNVTLKGSFPWNIGDSANGDTGSLGPWDTSKPGTAPAPPGNGNKYFDLRLLALGQHVTATCLPTSKTVQAAIDCLASLPDTKPGEIPKIVFDAQSAWLVGTEFGVLAFGEDKKPGQLALVPRTSNALAKPPEPKSGYMLTLQIVFNDPSLYGLRIALAGPAAKIFKGLDFQIMYRQISDSVGVYQAEITLPDVMRYLSVGAYSLTLPVFGISVYTNGDFQVDVGFPWNQDFSRSFTIEGIVYPGIPLIGSAGFYFGKLSSATSNQVPVVTNGTFNPVIVFGFGLQIGVGKSIRYGILSAGFSITVFGIIEGVIAKWNPYQLTNGGVSDNSQLQGAYYFWLRGTVGIIGKVFGSIDFAIIKADVNIEVKLMLQLTYESYVSIAITVIASVSVSVSISINLGLFSITIGFSFSMRLKETFTIENGSTPPWRLAGPPPTLLRSKANRRLRAHKSALLLAQGPAALNWSNLTESTTKTPLSGYFIPGLTVAHDEWDAANQPAAQIPCYVAVIAIESTPPPTVESQRLLAAQPGSAETSFEKLAKMALRWAIAAQHGAPISPEGVDASIITADALQVLIDFQLNSKDADPTPIPADAASEFMRRQFLFTLNLPTSENANTSFFPMPAELSLAVDAWGADQPLSYQFKNYNQLSDAMLAYLRKYFDELAVKVQQEQGAPPVQAQALAGNSLSMAEWILSDYFLLIVRQMVQAARDALRQFKVPLVAGDTPNKIAGWLKTTGGLEDYTLFELFAANPTHPLNGAKRLVIGVHAAASAPAGMLSFDSLARDAKQNVGAFSAPAIAFANAASVLILQAGVIVRYIKADNTVVTYTIAEANSTLDVAKAFKVSLADLLINSDILSVKALRDGAELLLPYATCRVLAGETFNSIAGNAVYQGGFTGAALARGNAGQSILRIGAKVVITSTGREYITRANDTLADVASGLDLTLAQLFEQTTVLADVALLAPVAVLQLPAFGITTEAAETLEQIVERFAISMDVLALTPANGDQVDLFLIDAKNLTLDAPHLPQFRVDELIKEIQRGVVLQQLSGMASRYYLHGLRLPTKQSAALGVQPLARGMWVREVDKKLVLPDRTGLYALTGQQFKVPVLPDAEKTPPFVFRLQRAAGPTWMVFTGGQQELTISIAYDSPDAKRIRKVTDAARAGATAISLSKLGRGVMLQSEPVRYAFASSLLWQSAAPVQLPYAERAQGGLPSLRIWRMPDAMINLARPAIYGSPEAGLLPRFGVRIARYDEATGATITTGVRGYGWATTIEFTVKRVPEVATSVSSKTTYELVGAAGNSVQLLERIIEQVQGNNSAFQTIYLGFAPEQTGPASEGIQTDAPAGLTFGIAQVNLSTITRPPTTAFGLQAKQAGLGMLNSPAEFLQLLWTASISRAGGFYLYYFDAEENRGLPERLFNDRNEAALVLTVIYSAPAQESAQNRVTDYMNAVAVGETVETVNSVVFAESNPTEFSLDSNDLGSLDAIALKYYADAAKIAVANEGRELAAGSKIVVTEGLYQPPPGLGVPLGTIQSNFSVTLDELRTANPRYNGALPDPVVFPVTLNLPRIEVTVGTSPSSGNFTAIAAYYGQAVASLASYAENRVVSPIFAPSQKIDVTSGAISNSATVPPGVQALLALRDAPPPVPVNPDAPNYADIFLANNFSLLSYTVAANSYFRTSNLGLPAGPTSKPAVETVDKLLIPAPVADVKEWTYQQSVPYSQFAIVPSIEAALFLPPAKDNPYRGVSDLLQIQFDWQDLYGNTLVTGLTSPTAGKLPYNQPPMRLGYTDALIGLSQWPSIASSYQVDAPKGSAQVQLFLGFDASRYEGVLTAKMPGAGSILVTFTQDVDKVSAETVSNYAIEGQTITAATVVDARTVRLTADLALDRLFALVVNQIDSADLKRQFSGQASFIGDQAISSSLTIGAMNALRTYQQLYYQFNDPFGVAFSVETSLLQKPIALSSTQVAAVTNWLFDGESGKTSIYQFLQDRAAGNTGVAPPPSTCNLELPIATDQLNGDEIFLLNLSFIVRRTGGAVLDELANTPGITRSETIISPQLKQVSGGPENPTLGLVQFAALFQNALSTSGKIRWKIATGVDRRSVTSARNGSALWVVRLGIQQEPQLPISYTIPSANQPAIFAPRPISNELQSHSVEITTYITGEGLKGPKLRLDFSNIDMDNWGRQFFASVDGVLTPEFTSATQIVGTLQSKNYLKDLLTQKELLAGIAKKWMIPAYDSESGADTTRVQEAYYQQMLTTLASAYTTRAALEYSAKVRAQVDEPEYPITPRLFGSIDLATPRILSAVSSPETPTMVLINFSSPMDVAQATAPANYTFTPSIGILSVNLSPDGKSAILQLNAEVQLNSTMVTVSTAVKDKIGRTLHPPLSWVIRQPNDARDVAREITFSSPKLDLKGADAAPIPFLVIAPENVRGGSGEIVATLELDLVYRGSDIEHQISRPEGVKGYVASSWLSVVIRDEDWPLERNLGVARIPMPLRSFPTAPAMTDQTPVVDPDAPDLSNLTRWSYTFTYSLPVHYPQDRVLCSVDFNLDDNAQLLAEPGLEGAFNEVAQFINTFPQVSQDLIKFLGAVDSESEAGSKNVVNAGVALTSTIEMLRAITDKATKEGGLVMPASRRLGLGDPNLRYSFYIEECSIEQDGSPQNGALLVTLVGAPPTGVGLPWVHVGDVNYKPERYLGNDCAGAACDNLNRFCFLYKDDAGNYLSAEKGQLIPARIVELPELDLFQRQNAQAVASIKRNVGLAEPFVYTTSDVSFANPLQPTVDSSRVYDIAALGSGQLVKRSLFQQLKNLFDNLLKNNQQPTITLQVEINYAYILNPALPPVPLPLLMQPATVVRVTGNGSEPTLDQVLTAWSEGITHWFETTLPLGTLGKLNFNLPLMTNLVKPSMPLLWTRNLELALASIDPPLPTR